MKILILIILIFIGFTGTPAQTDKPATPTSPALQEAAKLSAEVFNLFEQKKYDEALPLAQKVLQIGEKESGKTHLSVAKAWRNLAYIQQQRGKLVEAEKAFETAFNIYETNQPLAAADEKILIELLEIVATYQANDGEFDKAVKKLLRAVQLQEKLNPQDDLAVSYGLFKLGQIYQLKGEYDKAVPVFLRSLDIKAEKLGKTHEETKDVFDSAYCALSKLGQAEQATQLREKFNPPKTADKSPVKGRIPITVNGSVINGGIVNGKALYLAKPPYPAEAKPKRVKGAVTVQVTIDESGKVIFACALNGAKELHRTSERAAYNSRFAPTILDGKAVRISGVLVYNFVPN